MLLASYLTKGILVMADENNQEALPQVTATRVARARREALDILKNDVVGAADWKTSKLGYLTGYSVLKRSIGTVGSSLNDASDRLSMLMTSLTAAEPLQELEDGGTPRERFVASMKLHGKTPRDLSVILRNTYYSTLMYGCLALAYAVVIAWSLLAYPPHDLFRAMIRIGPLPMILALLFKHAFTNWIVREQSLGSASQFLFSGKLWPTRN